MENRREFLKKAGVAGGLGAAGALTLKKEYVKPVVRLLEPSAAYAQTPALSVGGAAWSQPVMDGTIIVSFSNTLTMTVDLPGGSAPIVGSTFNASMSLTGVAEPGGWGTFSGVLPGSTVTSNTIDNAANAGPGGVVQFACNFAPLGGAVLPFPLANCPLVNGIAVLPTGLSTVPNGCAALAGQIGPSVPGTAGDRGRICLNVDADAGTTVGGTSYPAQPLGSWCFEGLWS